MLHCRYQLACVFSLLDFACMGLYVFLLYHGMGFARCGNIFSLASPFPYSFDEMGSLMGLWGMAELDSKLSGVVIQIEKPIVVVVHELD